jgi:hypothetical protein
VPCSIRLSYWGSRGLYRSKGPGGDGASLFDGHRAVGGPGIGVRRRLLAVLVTVQ